MWYVIVGAVLALAGIGVAIVAVRRWVQAERRAASAEAQRDAATETNALAIRGHDAELELAMRRVADYEREWRRLLAILVKEGRAPAEALTAPPGEAVIAMGSAPSGPPHVEGIAPTTMQTTLETIAERALTTDRPLARPGLVVAGGLSRNQYDALRAALVEAGYFERPTGRQSPVLTPRGRAMLAAIREGDLVL